MSSRMGSIRNGWRFVLVGSSPDRHRLIAEVDDLTRCGVVTLVDPGLEVPSTIRKADVGVLMTDERGHSEGCADSIMEYMACALPVLCSDGGGNPELMVQDATGYLIEAGDRESQ